MKKKRKLFKDLIKEISYEWLYNYYIVDNHKRSDIALYLGVSDSTVKKLLKYFNIKKDVNLMMINHKKTMIDRYNVEVYSQHPDWIKKTINTNINKFGVEWYMKTSESKDRVKNTIQTKYGSIYNHYQNRASKAKKTLLNLYGDKNYNNKEKRRLTNLNKFGKEWYVQTEEFTNKSKETSLKNWGEDHYLKSKIGLEKYERQIYEKYGVKCIFELIHSSKILYSYDGEIFDSKPELAVWIYCKDHNINIIHNPVVLRYIYDNKEYKYFPDFKIDNKLVEIKGDHFIKDDGTFQNPYDHSQDALYEAKHQCGINNNVEFWDSKIYNKMIDYVYDTYGKNYLTQYRISKEGD